MNNYGNNVEKQSKQTILIVDDTKANIKILVEALRDTYTLGIAVNGQGVFKYLEKKQPDLILLDIMMPDMSGYEVCIKLKKEKTTRDIPIIFITALNEINNKTKGFELGAVDYITKPFEIAEVKSRVKMHLALKKAYEDLETQNIIISEVFGRHVDPAIAKQIIDGQVDAEGKMKDVTALFADIRNFTTYAESHEPTEVLTRVNRYFSEMAIVVEKHNGTVMQYVGDEIFAIFGTPTSLNNHAEHALNAALDMRLALESLNKQLSIENEPCIEHRIGLHSGKAIAGLVGSKERQSYALVGDTINTASRVASLCKTIKTDLLISESTVNGLKKIYSLGKWMEVNVKGRLGSIIVYKVN